MSLLVAAAAAFGLTTVSMFIGQVMFSTHQLRRRRPRLTGGDPGGYEWHVLMPALNEASVVGDSIDDLRRVNADAHVWVIDDASDDLTEAVVGERSLVDPRVHLLQRRAPAARRGKGDALNDAYRRIVAWREAFSGVSDTATIVGVVDADGRLSPQTFPVLAGPSAFADPKVGAVQQDVWMRNASDRTPFPDRGRAANVLGRALLRLQDVEFRSAIAGIQNARHRTQSVSMGGNGQWTRMSALAEVAGANADGSVGGPWNGSLLEDFELGIHVMMAGWRTRFLPRCWVSQEALPDIGRYLRQRTRWTQGTMQCGRYVPQLWRSAYVGPWALMELLYYLLQPWLWIVGTFLFPIPLIGAALTIADSPSAWGDWVANENGWLWLVAFVVMALGPLTSWGFTYRRIYRTDTDAVWYLDDDGAEHVAWQPSSERPSRLRALGLGLAYVVLVQFSYAIAWRALGRVFLKRSGWAKTSRNADQRSGDAVDVETERSATGALIPS